MQILWFDELDSTQKYLKTRVASKEIDIPVCVVTEKQTEGVGSRENEWIGYEGNLFFSFALNVQSLPEDLPLASASLYFAFILKEILRKMGSSVWLKWPNDFYIAEKKAGGMITNVAGDVVICGIGLNLVKSPETFSKLDIIIDREKLVRDYMKILQKKILWKQVFSKYKLEFHRNQNFFTHIKNKKVSLQKAVLCEDGSLDINGERIYSLR